MAASGRYEKKGDGTHYFSCYLRWYDTVTTTRSRRFDGKLPCMHFVATRSILLSFIAQRRYDGTAERTGEFGDAAVALRVARGKCF